MEKIDPYKISRNENNYKPYTNTESDEDVYSNAISKYISSTFGSDSKDDKKKGSTKDGKKPATNSKASNTPTIKKSEQVYGNTTNISDKDKVIKGSNAQKYKKDKSFEKDTGTISQGDVVEELEKNEDGKYSKVQLKVGTITWTLTESLETITRVTNSEQYSVAYKDVFTYKDPIGKTTGSGKNAKTVFTKNKATSNGKSDNQIVELNKKVTITYRTGKFVNIIGVGEDKTIYGWVYESDLFSQSKIDRRVYLNKYKDWLSKRLAETKLLDTRQMIDQSKAFLCEIEKVSVSVNSNTPVYPDIEKMNLTPSFSETTNRSSVPHELIGITRKFIELQEKTTLKAKESHNEVSVSTDSVPGGSLYDNIDWNARLGVPQYRTQSDNLLSPEATCVPTSYTMILERLGLNRSDIIKAIDSNLSKNNQTFNERAKAYFDKEDSVYRAKENNKKREKMIIANTKAKANKKSEPFKAEDIPALIQVPEQPNEGLNYQRLRGGTSGGMVGKEQEFADNFREKGQSEDLLGFLGFLLGYDERQKIGLETINIILNKPKSKITEETVRWSSDSRLKMKETLDNGGSILLGVSHKSGLYGGHVMTVQSVAENGLVVDDPFGGGNTEYKHNEKNTDFYAPKGTKTRTFNYKNKSHFAPNDAIGTQDFWLKSGQNLSNDEAIRDTKLLPYNMFDDGDFIVYIKLYNKPNN